MIVSEAILNQDPHVKSAVMFGRGKFNTGVIIDPRPEFAFDPSDKSKLAEFRNKIWCALPLFLRRRIHVKLTSSKVILPALVLPMLMSKKTRLRLVSAIVSMRCVD